MSGEPTAPPILHATLVAARRGGRWCGVLLQGPSGAGKSDLALRVLAAGWRLVADDRVRAWISGGALYGTAAERLRSLIEVRGLGVLAEPALAHARILMTAHAAASEVRLPLPERFVVQGVSLAGVRLDFHAASAPDKLDRALDAVLRGRFDRSDGRGI